MDGRLIHAVLLVEDVALSHGSDSQDIVNNLESYASIAGRFQ